MSWWILAALCAYFVKGLCGFANTLIFTSILSFGNNNVSISPIELLLGYPSNAILVIRERKSINWKICLPLAGLSPGILSGKVMDEKIVKRIVILMLILSGAALIWQNI